MSSSGEPASSPIAARFDSAIQWLLIALLAFMPFAFGAVDAWAEEVVIVAAAVLALCLALKLVICRHVNFVWTWSYLPLVLFVGLVLLQLTPLPDSWLRMLSPNTLDLNRNLLLAFPNNPAAYSRFAISLYRYETLHSFRLILAVAAIYVVTVNVCRTPSQLKRLLAVIAIIATSVALIDFLQVLSGTHKVYWLIPMGHRDSGPFANHSHYGQFINLSVGAMIGLALVLLTEIRKNNRSGSTAQNPVTGKWPVVRVLLLLAGILLCLATLCLSLTRGGMVAAVVAGIVTAIAVARTSARSIPRSWIFSGVCAACLIVLFASGSDGVFDRISTLSSLRTAADIRPQIARDLLRANKLFPIFGTGLGTHSVVYPVFQSVPHQTIAYDADDEYVQLAEEVGTAGLVLVGGFLAFIIAAYVRAIRFGRGLARAAAMGLGFGLMAILIQSASDFGQRIPAIACLTAVICAVIVNVSGLPKASARGRRRHQVAANTADISRAGEVALQPPRANSGFAFAWLALSGRCAGVLIVLLGLVFSVPQANAARLAESHWKVALAYESQIRSNSWMADNQQYGRMIAAAASANAYEPQNVRFAHWLNVYRWQAAARLQRLGASDPVAAATLRSHAARVIDEMARASALCPVFAPNYSVAGQLERLVLARRDGSVLAAAGNTLWPQDPNCALAAVTVAAADGSWDDASAKLNICVIADPDLYPAILDLLLVQHDRPDLAVAVAGEDAGHLLTLAEELSRLGAHASLSSAVRVHAADTIRQQPENPATTPGQLFNAATIYLENQNLEAADNLLALAVQREPGNIDWRLKYASVLADLGRSDEAVQEARLCLRLRPAMPEALDLIGNVYRHPRGSQTDRTILAGMKNAQAQ